MKNKRTQILRTGVCLIILFCIWTGLILFVDVKNAGESETAIGFASFNCWFHQLIGVHMGIYTLTDWLGLIPVCVCLLFAVMGFMQLVKRKSLRKVDHNILLLGVYYVFVIIFYLAFEEFPINYRPVLIEGRMEASYPSSTTLLILSVMPTLVFQTRHRIKKANVQSVITLLSILFSVFMVIGRLISGVHWFTDIIGSVLLSAGLFCLYLASVSFFDKNN